MRAIHTAAIVMLLGGVAAAESVSEPSTGQSFEAMRTVDGRPFALLGTGVRKKFIVKVYAMALYVDEPDARRAFPALVARAKGAGHAQLTSDDHAQSFVMFGNFAKLGVLHFVRDVDAGKIREAYEESLADELSDKSPPEVKQPAQALVALFDHDMKEGEEIVIHTFPDGRVEVTVAGAKKGGPHNPKLARAIWGIWLGPKPISTDMRKSLIDRIDVLGK